ncbi:MAG: hypothetical protein ACTSQP_24475 [Promethearchaeota archaeon]
MNNKNKVQKICKLKEILGKTLINCFIEEKCNPEIVRYIDGTIIFRSPKTKNPIIRYLKENIRNKNC